MVKAKFLVAISIFSSGFASSTIAATSTGHITGLGGVFVTSKNPKALAKWYREVLGIKLESWGGAILRYDAPGHPPMALWNAMPESSEEIAPSNRDFMINFAVDDLDALVSKLKAKGVTILKRQTDQTGKFASVLDPDGTKIELWQPPTK